MKIATGDISNRKQATAKLLFKPDGAAAWIDFGNVRTFKHENGADRTKTTRARKGYLETVDERPNTVEQRWTVGLDEELAVLVGLQLLAAIGQEVTQAAITVAATQSITAAQPGQVIVIGFDPTSTPFGVRQVNTVTVEDAGDDPDTYVLGTDYLLDPATGVLTILPTGSIAADSDLVVSYKAAQDKTLVHKSNTQLKVSGMAILDEFDQNAETVRSRSVFPAQIISSNNGDSDGKKNSEFEVQMLATGPIQRATRQY